MEVLELMIQKISEYRFAFCSSQSSQKIRSKKALVRVQIRSNKKLADARDTREDLADARDTREDLADARDTREDLVQKLIRKNILL